MKVQVQELSPIERKLSVEVEPEQVDAELGRAYAQLGRQVKLPGFRPGKIPRRILEQRFRGEVEQDVVRRLVERSYLDALTEHRVEAVGSPQVTNQKLAPGSPFTFEATVEVRPRVEPKDYQGLPLERVPVQVADAEVEARLEQMRARMATLEPIEGRDTAEPGDFAVVDTDGTVDGKPFSGGKAENVTMEIAPGDLLRGNAEALAGVRVGASKEIETPFPSDHPNPELAGKTGRFHLTLKSLKRQVTPALDDELAKEVGGGETLEALRTKVRADLEGGKRSQALTQEREALIQALIERNPFDLPKAMVERGVDFMLDGALRTLARQGMDPRKLNFDFVGLRDEMRPRAEKEVRGTLLFEAIADAEKIQVDPAEVDGRIEKLAKEAGQAVSQVRKAFKDSEQRRSLELRIREEKTVEFLRSRAKDAASP